MNERFPLGEPVNRKGPPSDLIPIPKRPNWFRHRVTGREVYVEPTRPKPGWPFPMTPYG